MPKLTFKVLVEARNRMTVAPRAAYGTGEQDLKRGAFSGLAAKTDHATETPNDSIDDGEPETMTCKFRSEERVEHSGLRFRRHAAAGVGDLQFHVLAFGQTV